MTHSTEKDAAVCGRCGVYRHLHPTKGGCEKSRRSWWWDEHYPIRHVLGIAWLALSEKRRWSIVSWYYDRHPDVCWCELVDAAYLDIKKDDYRKPNGCGCDVGRPTDAGAPRYGFCYCTPPATSVTSPEKGRA